MRLGLISDTHQPSEQKTLYQEVYTAFEGVDLILHGGDIIHPLVLDWLETIAPTIACQGNNDVYWTDPRMKPIQYLDIHGYRLAMMHDMEPEERPIELLLNRYLKGEHVDIIVTGDTHMERVDFRDGVLQINSGSPTLPHLYSTRLGTVGFLDIEPGRIEARIIRLGETEGRKNPGIEWRYTPEEGVVRLG